MSTKTLLAALAALVLIAAFAIRSALKLSERNAAIAALAPERHQLRAMTGRLEARLQVAKAARLESEHNSTASSAGSETAKQGSITGSAGNRSPDKPSAPVRRLSPQSIVANDPAKMAEYAKNLRDSLDWSYGGMFKALALSPEQIEKFKDAEVWLEEARMDLIAAIESQGLSPDSAEYKKLWLDYNNSRGPKKAEVLGDLTERYMEYYWTQSVRNYAQQLAWTGVFTGETVSSAQVERAADVLIANSKRRGTAPERHGVEWNTINWEVARAQLKDVLSPAQIETIGLLIENDKAQAKVNQRTSKLTADFKARSPAK